MKSNKKNVFKKCLFLAFLIIIITIVISISIKYSVVGEKTLPYSIEKILIVSTVDTTNNEDTENLWNISLSENNNVFIYIDKSKETTTDTIKEISLENFTITKNPQIGNIFLYRPTGELKNLYEHSTQNYLNDKITYTGARVDTLNTLEIGNEGGMMGFRVSLNDIGSYVSNNYDEELVYDGTLLNKAGITANQLEFSMSFDIIISLNSGVEFQGTISLDLPAGDIINEKEPYIEITDFSDVIFKRL
jgi:hypothetical protein